MTTPPGDHSELPPEADEADVAEQLAAVDAGENDTALAAPFPDAEASEGDLIEQAIPVPLDEDERA